MICSNCGHEIDRSDDVCPLCGTRVDSGSNRGDDFNRSSDEEYYDKKYFIFLGLIPYIVIAIIAIGVIEFQSFNVVVYTIWGAVAAMFICYIGDMRSLKKINITVDANWLYLLSMAVLFNCLAIDSYLLCRKKAGAPGASGRTNIWFANLAVIPFVAGYLVLHVVEGLNEGTFYFKDLPYAEQYMQVRKEIEEMEKNGRAVRTGHKESNDGTSRTGNVHKPDVKNKPVQDVSAAHDKAVVFTPMSNRDAGLRPMDSGAGKKPITCEPASQGLMQMLFSIKDLKTVNVSKNGIRTSFNDLEILENETYRKKCKARLKVDIKYDDARNFYDFVKSLSPESLQLYDRMMVNQYNSLREEGQPLLADDGSNTRLIMETTEMLLQEKPDDAGYVNFLVVNVDDFTVSRNNNGSMHLSTGKAGNSILAESLKQTLFWWRFANQPQLRERLLNRNDNK